MGFRRHYLLLCFALLLAATNASAAMTGPDVAVDCPGAAHAGAGMVEFEAPLANGCGNGRSPCQMHCPGIASSPAGQIGYGQPADRRTSDTPELAPAAPRTRLLRPPIPA